MFDVLKHATRVSLRIGAPECATVCHDVPAGRPVTGDERPGRRTPRVGRLTPRQESEGALWPDAVGALTLAQQSLRVIGAALARGREALHARDIAVASRDMADAMAGCRSLAIVTGLVLRAVSLPPASVAQADGMFHRLSGAADALALACRHDDWGRAAAIIGVDLPAILTEWALLTSDIQDALAAEAPVDLGGTVEPRTVLKIGRAHV